jgi:hypothetical protein
MRARLAITASESRSTAFAGTAIRSTVVTAPVERGSTTSQRMPGSVDDRMSITAPPAPSGRWRTCEMPAAVAATSKMNSKR